MEKITMGYWAGSMNYGKKYELMANKANALGQQKAPLVPRFAFYCR